MYIGILNLVIFLSQKVGEKQCVLIEKLTFPHFRSCTELPLYCPYSNITVYKAKTSHVGKLTMSAELSKYFNPIWFSTSHKSEYFVDNPYNGFNEDFLKRFHFLPAW